MPRDMSNAGQSPSDVARTPSGLSQDMVLGGLTKSPTMNLAGEPLTPHQKHVSNQKTSREIDEIAIKINEITVQID